MINFLNIKPLRIFYFFVSLALFSVSTECFAAGILDPTFGNQGVVTTDLGTDAAIHGLFAQTDGKIIVIAKNNGKYVLLRYNVNGTLDTNFGFGGKIVTVYDSSDAKVSVNILSNGLFAVGNQSSVVRYNEIGSAVSTVSFPAGELAAFRPDGKIVTATLINNPGACQGSHAKAISYKIFGDNGGSELRSGLLCGIGTYGLQSLVSLVPNPDDTVYIGARNLALNASGGFIWSISDSSHSTFQTPGRIGYNLFNVSSQADSRFVSVSNRAIIRGRTSSQANQIYNFRELGLTSMPYARIHGANKVAALHDNESVLILNDDFTFGGIASTSLYFAGAAELNSVFVQTDEKIIVAGQVAAAGGQKNIRLIRFSDVNNSAAPSFDFDADKKGDLSVFRQSNATWYTQRSSSGGFSAAQWGLPSDTPVPADFDGDGKFDYSVFRPSEGNWYILLSSNNQFRAVHFGQNGDRPLAADYDGDGRADLAVFRNGVWFFLDSSNNQFRAVQFGLAGDETVPADYDGDGKTDIAVYRDGYWYRLQSSDNAFRTEKFGVATDKPVIGDYDGDGQADQAVYRSGIWYLNRSNLGFAAVEFGAATDVPAPADYDGDGRTDFAFFRSGVWYLQRSAQGNAAVQFGLPNNMPITANN
jgi:(2Fe-2S) ferredoxin